MTNSWNGFVFCTAKDNSDGKLYYYTANTKEELKEAGVDMILYPLSAFRVMSKAAEDIYSEILEKGTQQGLIDKMQTRDELYEVLDYHTFEKKLDDLFEE